MMSEETNIEETLREGLSRELCSKERVLLVVPDSTRSGPTSMLFNAIAAILADQGVSLDVIVALGTHPPMSQDELRRHLGLTPEIEQRVRVMNHAWDDPDHLVNVGEIGASRVAELTGGLICESIPLTLNRAIHDYDRLLICGPVFPHEVAGFSGGSKYLFPGISGPEMIDVLHWLGALETNLKSIGRRNTPVRRLLDEGARQLSMPITAICYVVAESKVVSLSVGALEDAWRRAVEVSARYHVTRTSRTFRRVLSCAPAMYDDLWTGGKCMYKTEPVVEDGGEIVIYAPHITSLSVTHGAVMEQIGYHVRDYFVQQMERFSGVSKAIMAVSTYLKGSGTYADGIEHPRIRVSVASAIPRETCERVGLGYVDPSEIRPQEWMNREDEGILYVEKAGEILYLPEEA